MKTRSAVRRWLAGLVLAAAVLPSVVVARRALADDDPDEDVPVPTAAVDLSKKRKQVLAAIPSDETVLINVTSREMPASPDVLNLGKRGTKALARCVADNVDDGLRRLCASMLGRLGDRSALPALHGALEAWDPSVRGAAIAALHRMPDARSFEPLKTLLDREDEEQDNRVSILRALGLLSDQRAVKVLRTVLHDKDRSALHAPAFEALWKSRHLLARATLVDEVGFALKSQDSALIVAGTFAASELRAPELVQKLIPLMQNGDAHIRNRAVYALGRIGDKAATRALLDQIPKVREARMLNNIAFALERLDAAAFYATAKGLIEHKQAAIRMNAAFVLGDVKRPEGLPMLAKALDDKNDYVRVSTVAALGKLAAPEASKLLERFVDDANPTLKEEAIYATFALSGGKRTDLVFDKLYSSTDAATKLRAAIELGRAGDLRVGEDLLSCLEARRCKLSDVEGFLRSSKAPSAPGRVLLAWAKGRSELTDLLGALRPPGAGPLAVSDVQASLAHEDQRRAGFSIDLTGDLGEQTGAPVLEPLLASESTRTRLHVATALARLGHADAVAMLLRDFDNLPHDLLPGAVRIVSRIAEPKTRALLVPELVRREKGDDAPMAMAAASIRLAWEPESAIFRFLDALASPSAFERDLAERYLLRDRSQLVTSLLRRALARESRPPTRDRLRRLLDIRAGFDDGK